MGALRQVAQVPGLHILSEILCGLLGRGKNMWFLTELQMKCDGGRTFAKRASTHLAL